MNDGDDGDVSSLDGYESPHHRRYKEERLESARGCHSKVADASETCSTTVDTATSHGHEWNDGFGFKVERGSKVAYEWTSERINVSNSLMFATTPAACQLSYRGRSYKEIIEIFVRRTGDIDEDGNGTINVAWWEAKCAPGLVGRRYSGFRGKLPDWLPGRENCEKGFVGLSAFALPKLLRNALRCGTGLEDIDLVACHFQMQARRHSNLDIPCVRRLLHEKTVVLNEIDSSPWGMATQGEDAKTMLITILYGRPAPTNAGGWVLDFEKEQQRIRELDLQHNPKIFDACKHRRDPESTLEYYLNQDEERKCLDKLVMLATRHRLRVNAYEFDGLTGCGVARLVDAAEKAGLRVAMKPIPQTIDSLVEMAKTRHHALIWECVEDLEWKDQLRVVRDDVMARALRSLRQRAQVDHMAFASIVVPLLSGCFAIEREDKETLTLQYFCERRRLWVRGGGGRHLRRHVSDILRNHILVRSEAGCIEEPPTVFGNREFVNSITEEVKTHLPLAETLGPLDGNQTRGLVMFADGQLLELATGKLRPGEASDRISKCTGYAYPLLTDGELCGVIKRAAGRMCKFWDSGGTTFESGECDDLLDELRAKSPLYEFVYGLFENDDLAVWLIMQTVRALGGLAFEEFLYMSNSKGANGKGTWIALLMKLMGCGPANYFQTLEFGKHFIGTTRPGNCPEIAECEGKRVICINETSEMGHKDRVLNVELIKQLSAGLDAPITAMGNTEIQACSTLKPCSPFLPKTHPNFL